MECNLLGDTKHWIYGPEFWRVSTDGKATIIEPYLEDQLERCNQVAKAVGTWINPDFLIQTLAEFIRHSRAMAERFDTAASVSFRCEWNGIADRQLFRPYGRIESDKSREDHRFVTMNFPFTTVIGDWPSVASRLAGPLVRAFTTRNIVSPEFISRNFRL